MTKNGSHSTNIANKVDRRVDSDLDHCGNITVTQSEAVDEPEAAQYTRTDGQTRVGTFTRRETEPSRPVESRGAPRSSLDDTLHHGCTSKNSTAPLDEPLSTTNTHKSDFLNLLDPRVNRGGSKQMRSSGS